MRLAIPVHRIVLLEGRRRLVAAAASGAASALAMPPFDLWPLLFITFPVVVWLLDGTGSGRAGLRDAAATGFAFGFGYFLSGLWWIGTAFFVPGDSYQWLAPFAVIGLPLFLALYYAAGFALARALWSDGVPRIFALALGLGAAEWLRGHALTGFPWNELGYALANAPLIGQSASLIGVEGLTLVAIVLFAAPATLADEGAGRLKPTFAAAALLALMAAFGAGRLALAGEPQFTDVRLRIMQPDVPQDDKFRPSAKDAIMARYLALSDQTTGPNRKGMADVDVLIWPESAFPFFLARTPDALAQIAGLLPDGKVLLTGAARMDDSGPGARRIYNSVHVLAGDGTVVGTYDKVHLVPGGEFLPFQDFLESLGLRQLTRLPGGFTAGDGPRNLALPGGVKFGPLICYEAIFPTGVYDPDERPDALINVTNDGWFGDTPGPHQHFAEARVRAIEQGLPLIRAANTGISAVVDPWGRVLASLPLGEEGVIDIDLPASAAATPYARYGLYILVALWFSLATGALYPFWRV